MKVMEVSRATLGRIPLYLRYLSGLTGSASSTISATVIANELGFGEVQVRKDLGAVCGCGKPKVGYIREELVKSLESVLSGKNGGAVIIGAGQLGRALLDYDGFASFGISVQAAFDINAAQGEHSVKGKPILPMERFAAFCSDKDIRIGIIAVPGEAAQEVCNLFYENGIKAMWCFASRQLYKPADAIIQYENMALSLAHLKNRINEAI